MDEAQDLACGDSKNTLGHFFDEICGNLKLSSSTSNVSKIIPKEHRMKEIQAVQVKGVKSDGKSISNIT